MSRMNDLTSVVRGSSRSSFLHTICKFVRDVDEMNDTVLVPSMLTDLCSSPKVTSTNNNTTTDSSDCFDLQTLHSLLNRLKDELTIARFDEDSISSPANIFSSSINCNSQSTPISSLNSPSPSSSSSSSSILTTSPPSSSSTSPANLNSTSSANRITSSSSSNSLRIAEGDLTGLSKKLHSCKCSGSSDDGFSSLNSYSRNSEDEESTTSSSSPVSDSDSECCSSHSNPNQCRENHSHSESSLPSIAESSPEYIVNLLRLHIQGIQSILTRFSKYADHVSESYEDSLQ